MSKETLDNWERLYNVISNSFSKNVAEDSVKKILDGINSLNKSNTIVYNNYTDGNHTLLLRDNHAFVLWICRCLFRLLTIENVKGCYEYLVETQVFILKKLSIHQQDSYNSIVSEYSKALSTLNKFYETDRSEDEIENQQITLNLFIIPNNSLRMDLSPVPIAVQRTQCLSLQFSLIKILQFTLCNDFQTDNVKCNVIENLQNLIIITMNSPSNLKFLALEAVCDLADYHFFNDKNSLPEVLHCFNKLVCLQEQILYEYLKKINLEEDIFRGYELLLTCFFQTFQKYERFFEQLERMCCFVINNNFCSNNISGYYKASNEVLEVAVTTLVKVTRNKSESFENYLEYVKLFLKTKNEIFQHIVEKKITKEVNNNMHYCNESESVFKSTILWTELHNYLLNLELVESDTLLIFLHVYNILRICVRIKTNVLSYSNENSIKCNVDMLDGNTFIRIILRLINKFNKEHFVHDLQLVCNILVTTMIVGKVYDEDSKMILQIISYPICKKLTKNYYEEEVKEFYNIMQSGELNIEHSFQLLRKILQSGVIFSNNISEMQLDDIFTCSINMYGQLDSEAKCKLINCFPFLMIHLMKKTLLSNMLAKFVSEALNLKVKLTLSSIIPGVICLTNGNCLVYSHARGNEIYFGIRCLNCSKDIVEENKELTLVSKNMYKINGIDISQVEIFLKLLYSENDLTSDLKLNLINNLLSYLNHIPRFHTKQFTTSWVRFLEDKCKKVREKFCEVIYNVLEYNQNCSSLSIEYKEEEIKYIVKKLGDFIRNVVRTRNYEVQETLLETCKNLGTLKNEYLILNCVIYLIHFVMIPITNNNITFLSTNAIQWICKSHNTSPKLIFIQFKKDILKNVTNLCYLNYKLFSLNLENSLIHFANIMQFNEVKELLAINCHHFLSFLIPYIIRDSSVSCLMEEIATLLDTIDEELLKINYSNIYLHLLLNEKEIFHKAVAYLEKRIGAPHSVIKKRIGNSNCIVNELLLKFHEQRDQVIAGLELLTADEPEVPNAHSNLKIANFLQPRILGVLNYFDLKLINTELSDSSKKQVILSLASIMTFLGPKYITPIRFKVFVTLRTALLLKHSNFPELNCKVWNAFVHNCDIEALGPQLASIFISLISLLDNVPQEINEIFEFLIVKNERVYEKYIPDLFFVVDLPNVPSKLKNLISNRIQQLQVDAFPKKLEWYLKYLEHETQEVKIYSLRHLKTLLDNNRDELDTMILGYNGIDPLIVRLINVLSKICKEQNSELRLACGECIGALGAIEPSHLPRVAAEAAKTFTYFLDDDTFIFNAISELIRTLQAEQNTSNVDRLSLALQEMLKTFNISPEPTSQRNYFWEQFKKSQTDILTPLLSSRYIANITIKVTNICPIYRSNIGANYDSWIHNWTEKLITSVEDGKRSLLEKCFPSLKQDNKILMLFLPYILLHALLEGTAAETESIFVELQTVIDSTDGVAVRSSASEKTESNAKTMQEKCIQTVFILFDFLDRWVTEWKWDPKKKQSDKGYCKVQQFLSKFSALELSRCNYYCREYLRALVYLERYLVANPESKNNHLSYLSEIYSLLNESDAVYGISALQQTEPTLEQCILLHEVEGKLADAAACYEKMPMPLKLRHIKGLMKCYIDLDNVTSALNFARGAIEKHSEYKEVLLEDQAEALWRLGQYDDLNELMKKSELEKNSNWGVLIGKALLNFRDNNAESFKNILNLLYMQQVKLFGATSLKHGIYQDGYPIIARLNSLKELDEIKHMTEKILEDRINAKTELEKLLTDWDLRLKVTQESIKIVEPILCLRRVGLQLAKRVIQEKIDRHNSSKIETLFNVALGNLWLKSANLGRNAGMVQQAYTYTLRAEEYNPTNLFLEKAKLHWMREEREMAFTTLNRGIEKFLNMNVNSNSATGSQKWAHLSKEDKKICAEAKLLIATYNDAHSNVDFEINLNYYREAVEVLGECEKSLVCLAQYYDRVFSNFTEEERDSIGSDVQVYMINYFGKSLQYGTEFIYQSMPRLLSIWFDYGTRAMESSTSALKQTRRESLLKMTKLIDTFLDRLPAFIFLSAFSQIMSRICHPQNDVYVQLKKIIVKLIQHYPQQTMWMMVSVLRSSYTLRSKRCSEILNDPRLKSSTNMKSFITDFTHLADKLIELCNKPIGDNVHSTSVSNLVKTLPKLLADSKFSQIIVPVERFRKLTLPNPDLKHSEHNPFQNQYVYIAGIDEKVTILPSLQKPRKISFRGSDGKEYIHMLKPKDDLRRDFRLMEFNGVVNHLLMRDGESRQRRLYIRTYSVAPLNEECGLLEWINNLVGLRPILINIYKHNGIFVQPRELKSMMCSKGDPLQVKRDIFLKKLLPKHPPVLSTWFQKTFPDIQGWLSARTAYTRTTAVMSMVGYMLGLGDRHGENILYDCTNGDTVHVDFNCLFNKGEQFDWSEKVPFRLTHNMVSAMGPLGVEGTFRKSCVVTLKVLRSHTDTLMSIVTPFVYDPLVTWNRNNNRKDANNSEMTNEQAMEHLRNIKLRLQGIPHRKTKSYSIPLSVEGQANHLIIEATNVDNLCRMYVGWGAFL